MKMSYRYLMSLPLLLALSAAAAPEPAVKKIKPTKWLNNYQAAVIHSRQQDKVILMYFSGSDWDAWSQKLDQDVLNTAMFQNWAEKNVILLQVDFPRYKHLSGSIGQQNERLKQKFSVSRTATVVFVDPFNQPFARAGYDELCLRDQEKKDEPKQAIAFLDDVLKHRPKPEALAQQSNIMSAMSVAKKKYGLLLMMIMQPNARTVLHDKEELLQDQQFVKFINRNLTFVQTLWPESDDTSTNAQAFRAFAARHALTQEPFQLVLWDAPYDKVKAKISGFDLNHVEKLINLLQVQLPKIDYTGGWVQDFNMARTIASQQDKFLFLAFTSMDGGEWSRKVDQEIFQSEPFKDYAKKNFVLVRLDFPTAATQPALIADQNKTLAEMYNIRGYPTVVIMNPLGQKVVDTKYIKGGPQVFLSQLDPILKTDSERRAALKD